MRPPRCASRARPSCGGRSRQSATISARLPIALRSDAAISQANAAAAARPWQLHDASDDGKIERCLLRMPQMPPYLSHSQINPVDEELMTPHEIVL